MMGKEARLKQKANDRCQGQNEVHQDDAVTLGSDSTTSSEILSEYVKLSDKDYKHIRETYRDLMDTAQEKADGAGEAGLDTTILYDMVHEADKVFIEVKRPREAAMDAQFLKTCGSLAKLNIESAQSNLNVFRPKEYAQKLMNFMTHDDEGDHNTDHPHWQRFGKDVSPLYKRAIGIEPLYGAIEWQRPKPAPRVKKAGKDSETIQQVEPKEMMASVVGEERQTEEVSRIFKILKTRHRECGNRPVCFFSFVINPNSYSLTTENLFHTSFLLRDQYAVITEDENGLPVITPRQTNMTARVGGISHQCIISLSKKEWRSIIETFRIENSMIPPSSCRVSKRKS
ncbi:non-structural maintenance of chromosomes element 4 homolog A isoform X1 [Panulirus ornatus]|uniref:non-structural maintenance of chromosomes element 4 homolog A isoform X1 n=2 Tax=Panulirus ornatus TaxID=150431 RepID=UPI003A887B99